MEYKAFTTKNLHQIKKLQEFPEEFFKEIELLSAIYPVKTNNYVIDELIDWKNVPDDPIFRMNFPNKEMLIPEHYERITEALRHGKGSEEFKTAVNDIRMELNPHPAEQLQHNVPLLDGKPAKGLQHKYRETVLFFPKEGQTCHAYCTFCFRWPQFIHERGMKIMAEERDILVRYLRVHPEVTNILFTGGDPLIISSKILKFYIEPLLSEEFSHIHTIRIGTKALSYWPYRFTQDKDSQELLDIFRMVIGNRKQLAIMAHFNHYRELETEATQKAIKAVLQTGALIRTQSPLLKHINDSSEIWKKLWRMQLGLGCIPYYMFIARDTGAKHYFEVPLTNAYEIYREAYSQISGLGRTVRGPSMSAAPGKIHILGIIETKLGKFFILQFLQARNPEWVRKPFLAKYNPKATWISELEPAFDEKKFFWEEELTQMDKEASQNLDIIWDDDGE